MAWNTCFTYINSMFGCNTCDPLLGGYTGRALLVPWEYASEFQIVGNSGQMTFVFNTESPNYQNMINNIIPIFDKSPNPFEGTSTAGNTESGRNLFKKTVQFILEKVNIFGASNFMNIFFSNNNGNGFFIIIERKVILNNTSTYRNAMMRYEVIGRNNPLTYDGDSFSRNEYENAGALKFSMSTTEKIHYVYARSNYDTNGSLSTTCFNQWWNSIVCYSN